MCSTKISLRKNGNVSQEMRGMSVLTEQLGSHKSEVLPFAFWRPKIWHKSNTERLQCNEWTGKTRDKDKDNRCFDVTTFFNGSVQRDNGTCNIKQNFLEPFLTTPQKSLLLLVSSSEKRKMGDSVMITLRPFARDKVNHEEACFLSQGCKSYTFTDSEVID